MTLRRVTSVLVVLGAFCASVLSAPAADAFTISPTRYVLTADAGTNQTLGVDVTNTDSQTVLIEARVTGVSQDALGRPVFGTTADPVETWIVPDPVVRRLDPGQKTTLTYIVRVPLAAPPGSHYAGLAVKATAAGTSGTSLSPELITLVSLQVAGTAREEVGASLGSSSAIIGQKMVRLPLTLQNAGNIEVPLSGTLRATSALTGDSIMIPISLGNQLLAGASRRLEYPVLLPSTWASFLPVQKTNMPTVSVRPGEMIENFRSILRWPGPYDFTATITYGKTGQVSIAALHVWYIPAWSLVAAAIIVMIVIILFAGLSNRRRNRNAEIVG